jgi:hypothetical protein
VLVSLSGARLKARDAKRIADMRSIRTALEFYFAEKGYYPPAPLGGDCTAPTGGYDCNNYAVSSNASWTALAVELSPYIRTLPKDVTNSPGCFTGSLDCFVYQYGNVGRSIYSPQYDLSTRLEDTTHPLRCTTKQYKYFFNNIYFMCPGPDPDPGQVYEASP